VTNDGQDEGKKEKASGRGDPRKIYTTRWLALVIQSLTVLLRLGALSVINQLCSSSRSGYASHARPALPSDNPEPGWDCGNSEIEKTLRGPPRALRTPTCINPTGTRPRVEFSRRRRDERRHVDTDRSACHAGRRWRAVLRRAVYFHLCPRRRNVKRVTDQRECPRLRRCAQCYQERSGYDHECL